MCVANLTFEVNYTDQQARVGILKHARGQLETPAILIYTKRGSPMFLTPDMMNHLGPEGQCYILDGTKFLGNPTPETISKAPSQGRGFCALQDKFLVVSARDSMVYNYPRWDRTNNGSVRVDAFAGNQDLSPEEFLRTAEGFTPDLMVPLSDEMPAEALEPRVRLGVTRSLRWLDVTLKALQRSQGPKTSILAPIQGGTSVAARQESAAECSKREGVFGFAICGMGTGETPGQRRECLQAVTSHLPAERPRLLQGALTPDGMLEAAALGVDLFDATYATQVTLTGHALDIEAACSHMDATGGHDDLKVNMLDPSFRMDKGPLVPNCTCFTCRHHTRAYIHHLMLAHEMTAQILLELHNLHQLLHWFSCIRACIKEGTLDHFREAHQRRRQSFRGLRVGSDPQPPRI